jgi:3-hydroxymyristoyl/3-hydroxydecanoyl-(acyl carrier protein) dehydratase
MAETIDVLNIDEIKKLIPHRAPILLIDRVENIIPIPKRQGSKPLVAMSPILPVIFPIFQLCLAC